MSRAGLVLGSGSSLGLGLSLAFVLVPLSGCTLPVAETSLEAASIEGSIVIGDAFVLQEARLSIAPADAAALGTPGRAVELAQPPWTARTALARDHWVIEATLVERAPGTGAGVHRVLLDWNGERAGEVYVEGARAPSRLAVVVRFDVGPAIERSNAFAIEIARAP